MIPRRRGKRPAAFRLRYAFHSAKLFACGGFPHDDCPTTGAGGQFPAIGRKGGSDYAGLRRFVDLPNLLPAAISFGIYHLKHHAHQGHYEVDADIPNQWEARLVGDKWYGKAIWLFFFPIFQLTRPPRLKAIAMWNSWTVVNVLAVLGYGLAVFFVCGWLGLWYLGCSFFFSVGLHPVGARWVQEHYTLDPDQETFSYYGPINRVALNVGYHNEHHDFPSIAWNNLPKLRALAPEFYDSLRSHSSWTRLLIQFLFDRRYTLFSRVERSNDLPPIDSGSPRLGLV